MTASMDEVLAGLDKQRQVKPSARNCALRTIKKLQGVVVAIHRFASFIGQGYLEWLA